MSMHTLRKIKIFRALQYVTYPLALLLLYPLALMKRKTNAKHIFFWDRYDMGGAQRVHVDIMESIKDKPKHQFFTRFADKHRMKEDFFGQPNSVAEDIHFYCDNLLLRLFSVHFYAFYVNRHRGAHVFSGNSTFFFDMLPFLGKDIITTELLHAFNFADNGMEYFGLGNHKYLDHRIVIDGATKQNILNQYKEFHVESQYAERVLLIEPGVPMPPPQPKTFELPLKIMYAGRGGHPKRIYLMNEIAEYCIKNELPVQFHFAGTLMDELSDLVKANSVLHGEINGQEGMYALYNQCHAIIMTSAWEGFPMLVKESMACGCIPVVTGLNGIKSHLRHMETALFMEQPENEEGVVKQGIELLQYLTSDIHIATLSAHCYAYAREHFDKKIFTEKIRKFLLGQA